MRLSRRSLLGSAAGLGAAAALTVPARAQQPAIKVGVLTDMSGPYQDLAGPGSIAATQLVASECMAATPGARVEIVSADHQNQADIAAGNGPEQYLVALGCAGWDAGQLDREITDNVWLTTPALPDLIFSDNHAQKAEQAASILGVSLSQLSAFAGHS